MSAYRDAEWNEVRELEVETARLQRERAQIELDLIQMAEQCERLRAALEEIAKLLVPKALRKGNDGTAIR